MNIYETNKKTKTENEIKYLIATSINDLKFKDNDSYFFINSNKGQAILFDNKITLDTYVDVWDLKDLNNQPIIQIQAKIAKEQKEGFVTNKFIKPNSSDKTNRIIDNNPILQTWTKDKDSVEQKKFGSALITPPTPMMRSFSPYL